jgi:hypothetical protein
MKVLRAHVKDGLVVNMSAGDTDRPWIAPYGITVVELKLDSDVAIGYSYDGKEFKAPTTVEPILQPTIEARLAQLEKSVAELKAAKP